MPTKISAIEAELQAATKVKQKKGEQRQGYLKRLLNAVRALPEGVTGQGWELLTDAAQDWANDGITASGLQGKEIVDFPVEEEQKADTEAEEEEDEESTEPAADANEAEEAAPPRKDKKVSTKAKKATKAKPEKAVKAKAAKNGNGAKSVRSGAISTPWKKALGSLGKSGDKGLSSKDFAAICKKSGTGPYWARYIRSGHIERLGRGMFKLTSKGQKAVTASSEG